MESRSILIPIDRDSAAGYTEYLHIIVPCLRNFGLPYQELSLSELSKISNIDCALIFIAQRGLSIPDKVSEMFCAAVRGGAGLVCVDEAAMTSAAFSRMVNKNAAIASDSDEIQIKGGHYITALHEDGERISLYSQMAPDSSLSLDGGEILVSCGGAGVLEASRFGAGKVALWHTLGWCSHKVLGPIHGMDDILWRSIVWAARKPFVMKGMPPFIGMRIDDVWGAWRNINPENPLSWVDTANKYGIKPWLGVFQDNINEAAIKKLKSLVDAGNATAFPHAFAGCEWVGSPIPEHWIYLDHNNMKPYSDEVMRQNAARAKSWFDNQKIPISKVALGHYYEMGLNALQYLIEWGCEFVGVHMQPDNAYLSNCDWIRCAPYHLYETDVVSCPKPVYNADYLRFIDHPELSDKLFNCVVEIRDVCGYEWAPSTDVESTVKHGVEQLRRAFDSCAPGFLFTHESKFIQRMMPDSWDETLSKITQAVSGYKPTYDTMDNIYKYVRASHDINIENASVNEGGKLVLTLSGKNDMSTKCSVFSETGDEISQEWVKIPRIDGRAEIAL